MNTMCLKWIKIAHTGLSGSILVLLGGACLLYFTKVETSMPFEGATIKRSLPKSSFEFPADVYASLKADSLVLNFVPPHLHLPDLRNALSYYGQNGRPDVSIDAPRLFFGIQGGKYIASASPNEKIFLHYDKSLTTPCKYIFSPNNEPTMIWFTAEPEGNEAKLTIEMSHEGGILIAKEDPNRFQSVPEKEFARPQGLGPWEIGKWRVDGSLMARQKARWVGIDRFLEKHGGEEFPDFSEKQRIDFGEGDELYSIFVKKGDCLVWDEDRWHFCDADHHSQNKPLLVIRKIEEKVMSMDIWDKEGKGKVALALIKAPEHFQPDQVTHDFRFVGARTKTQVVFQIDEERLIVKPNDWLLLTKEGWRKLDTVTDIDDFVSRKLVGTLFIFNEIAKKEEKTILMGSIYTPTRTSCHEVEVAMLPAGTNTQASPKSIETNHSQQPPTPLATSR